MPQANRAGRGREGLGIFRVDAAFHRVTADLDVLLLVGQRFARRDPKLPLDQIEASDFLGHGMLDLKPRVHLEKVEVFGRRIDDEFHRPCGIVADRGCEFHRVLV